MKTPRQTNTTNFLGTVLRAWFGNPERAPNFRPVGNFSDAAAGLRHRRAAFFKHALRCAMSRRRRLAWVALALVPLLSLRALDAQEGGCYVFITPGSTDRGYGAAMGTVSVSAATNCAWAVVNTNSWITILSSTNGMGDGQVVYEIEANPDMQSRSGSFTIGGRLFTIRQAGHSFVSLPADQVVALDGTATFSVTVANITPPFTYQWQFNSVDLMDGGGISGAATSTLVLTGVQYSQAGHYRCVVSNSLGANFSSSATLTVAPTTYAHPLAEALDT